MLTTQTMVPETTVGLDLGDRKSAVCQLDGAGNVVDRRVLPTTPAALIRYFSALSPARVVLEVGTHSPWISRLLERLGHEVLVANAARLRGPKRTRRKNDRIDAEALARKGRVDPKLVFPIQHRGEVAQADLVLIRSRDALVRCRTLLVNEVRGVVKSLGARLHKCSAESFHRAVREEIPDVLRGILAGVLSQIEALTKQIRAYDREVERKAEVEYPETARMRQICGVGALTALCFALVIEDPTRFENSRAVGPYLGLVPDLDDSGEEHHELPISKAGDELCRKLLVQAAQYILGPFGPDTDLRRWGLRLAGSGGSKKAKKRAVIAVARKLAVLLHRLWTTGERYEPLHNAERAAAAA
jgi:transposase